MRASHDLFDYGFSEDSPMRLPAVSVEVAAGVYSSNHTFQSPEAANLRDSVSKVGLELSGIDLASPCQILLAQTMGGAFFSIKRSGSSCRRDIDFRVAYHLPARHRFMQHESDTRFLIACAQQ